MSFQLRQQMVAPVAQQRRAGAKPLVRIDQLGHGQLLDHGAGHVHRRADTAERGHGRLLDALGAEPLLRLDLRLGEGSGAALALPGLAIGQTADSGNTPSDGAGYSGRADVRAFAAQLQSQHGVDARWCEQVLAQARFLPRVPPLMLPPSRPGVRISAVHRMPPA